MSFLGIDAAPHDNPMDLGLRFHVPVGCGLAAVLAMASPARAADPPIEPSSAAPSLLTVHVASPMPVALRRRTHDDAPYEDVCVSPCDALVPRDGDYVIDDAENNGVRNSQWFHMPVAALRADIGVRPRSRGGLLAGILVTSTGASAVILALLVASARTLGAAFACELSQTPSCRDPDQSVAVAIGVAGGIVAFAGLPIIANYAHTLVNVSPPASPPTAPSVVDAPPSAMRPAPGERLVASSGVGFPLFRVAF